MIGVEMGRKAGGVRIASGMDRRREATISAGRRRHGGLTTVAARAIDPRGECSAKAPPAPGRTNRAV
jgi:hypothetical protein